MATYNFNRKRTGYEVIRGGQGMSTIDLQPGDIPVKVITPTTTKKKSSSNKSSGGITPSPTGYEVIRDGQGMSTEQIQPGDIPVKVISPPISRKISPAKEQPQSPKETGVLTIMEDQQSNVEGRTPYWTVRKDITPSQAIAEGNVMATVPTYYSPIGTTKGTYEETQLNIVQTKKAQEAQEKLQKEAQTLLSEKVGREEYGDLIGQSVEGGVSFTLKEQDIKSLPSYSAFDESGYFKFDRTEALKDIRKTEGSFFGSKNLKLSAGDLWTWGAQTITGVGEFGVKILEASSTQLIASPDTLKDQRGSTESLFTPSSASKLFFGSETISKPAPLKDWYKSTFWYDATQTPLAPSTTSFKYTSPSTWKSQGWEYIKEIPQRPAVLANVGLSAYLVGRAATGAYGIYSTERVAGATRWGATGTVFGETLSGITPMKIQSGIIGTSYTASKTSQLGDVKQDFSKLGSKGGKDYYSAFGEAVYTTPVEFKWGSIKYGWGGITPKISSISAYDIQSVTLGRNIFTGTTSSNQRSLVEGLGNRNILNIRNIPVQTSKYGFDFTGQVSSSTELFKGWGEAISIGSKGFSLGKSNFYFTPDKTTTFTSGYTSGGKFVRPTLTPKIDTPVLTDVKGFSISKTGKGYTIPGAYVIPGKSFSFIGSKSGVLISPSQTRIISPFKDISKNVGSGFIKKGGGSSNIIKKVNNIFKPTTPTTTDIVSKTAKGISYSPQTTNTISQTIQPTISPVTQPKIIQLFSPAITTSTATTSSSLFGGLSISGQKQSPKTISDTKLNTNFLDATATLSSQISGTSSVTDTTTKSLSKSATATINETLSLTAQPVLIPSLFTPSKIKPRVPKPTIPRGNIILLKFPKFSGTTSRPKTQGYIPQAKSGNKWVSLSKNPLTRSSALSRGARAVDNTTSSQFRIVKRKGKVVSSVDNYFGANQFKFRPYKIKKGKGVSMTNQYIEKRSSRIDTPGEKRGLKVAKWKKQTGGNWLV